MARILIVGMALVWVPVALLAQNTGASSVASATIKTYCVSCHTGPANGRLYLDQFGASDRVVDFEIAERLVRQLRARTMPPRGAQRPDNATYDATIRELTLDRAAPVAAQASDAVLAARLAKLLWSAEPDQPLRDAAANGMLHNPSVLQAMVRRMLGSSKANAFVTGFFGTWLSLDQLTTMQGDAKLFPEFDDDLRKSLRQETELFVASQLREDRSPLELWTANYTFLNERLARHYAVPNVSGPDYRRVTWPRPERAGLLGQGSILTLTSYFRNGQVDGPTTSPAMRGKFILGRFLGVNPPTPLPGIPSADYPFTKHNSLVTQSRTFPATPCLACHQSFFPLSYGLENFDLLGRWRSHDGADPIDASGTMVDGRTFNGPIELRSALLDRQDAFLNNITERLMAYATGGATAVNKPTPAGLMPAVRVALHEAGEQGRSWSSLIAAIVKAQPEPR